jgi:hypothetical protein
VCIFFARFAFGTANTSFQVQSFMTSLTSELQRLLPDETKGATLHFHALPDNVTALLPKDVSNSTALGLLSGLGSSSPSNFTACLSGWLKSALAKDIAVIVNTGVTIFAPLWGLGVGELLGGICPAEGRIACTAIFGVLGALGLPLFFRYITVPLDETLVSLLLCILNIKPGQVSSDPFKKLKENTGHIQTTLSHHLSTQWISLGKLLQDGHGFEAGFKVGVALEQAWLRQVAQQPSVVV